MVSVPATILQDFWHCARVVASLFVIAVFPHHARKMVIIANTTIPRCLLFMDIFLRNKFDDTYSIHLPDFYNYFFSWFSIAKKVILLLLILLLSGSIILMIHPMADQKIYGSVTVNTKWQIIIHIEARQYLGIKAGDKLLVTSRWKCFLGFMKAANVREFIEKLQMGIGHEKKASPKKK